MSTKINDLNKSKVSVIVFDKELEKLQDKVLFPKKLDIANKILEKPPLNDEEVKNDFNYICNKLGYDLSKLYSLEKIDKKFYFDYKNTHKILKPIELILKILKLSVRGGAF